VSRAVLALAAAGLACAPALRGPAPGAPSAGAPAPPGGSAAELLAQAREHLAHRAEPGEAGKAEQLFLSAAEQDPRDVEGLYGAIQARIWRIDHEPGVDRAALSSAAVDSGQACLQRAPESATCHYGLALALGVQARERRATARDGLRKMVQHLRAAAQRDPALDQAGPDRVLALVLTRAPGWPVGPGDPEEAVEAARRAVQQSPDYPPNPLALAEAQIAAGHGGEARSAARQAVALARARAGDPQAGGWVKEGEALLARARAVPGS
jgi:hypothetical protein